MLKCFAPFFRPIALVAMVGLFSPSLGFGAAAPAPVPTVPAFPGAEGGGAFSVGGRGGRVIEVTNLADSGPGSLRAAVEAAGPRIVVFRVSGLIDLRSDLVVSNSKLTIAGQTAPGDGICLKRHSLKVIGADEVVIRYLRVRPGAESGQPLDGIEVRDSRNVILDHCSVGWSIDEAVNTWHGVKNITVQWCLIAEPLNRSVHPKGAHGYGASLGAENGSYHHNLFAHATARNPSVAGNHQHKTVNMDFRCSVIYNWQHRTCDGKPVSINFVNNYLKPGPATQPDVRRRIVRIDDTQSAYGYPSHWFVDGNFIEGAPEISADNWRGGVEYDKGKTSETSEASNRRREPFPVAAVTTQSATEAYALVLAQAGATLPRRDRVDARIVADVAAGKASVGNGIIDSTDQVGGWPEYRSILPPVDTDRDGMPDAWERAQGQGFDINDPADGPRDPDKDGYTNLEEYLNGTAPKEFIDYTKPGNNVSKL
jgi:pectate lyase